MHTIEVKVADGDDGSERWLVLFNSDSGTVLAEVFCIFGETKSIS